MPRFLPLILLGCVLASSTVRADELQFKPEELKTKLTVGYAVQLVDMNGDGKKDIVIVDSKRFLWLENPTWEEHVMHEDQAAKADNVCFFSYDIDGDGKLDFAVGRDWQPGNTKAGGTIGWLQQGKSPADPWRYHPIAEEPTTHRLRFADLDGDGKPELIVAPLKGRDTTDPKFEENGVRLLSFKIPADPVKDEWPMTVINDKLHVMHNFYPVDVSGDKQLDILCASFEGVTLLEREQDAWRASHIGEGEQATSPNRGASEIKLGRLANGAPYIGTIEPWHGHEVVVYAPPQGSDAKAYREMWTRVPLDKDLLWGHAVWCANLDGDKDEELIIGVRDHKDDKFRSGLRIYDPQDGGAKWQRHIIDPGGVNIEDLAADDLDGDGKIDIVAVGRQSHNVKIYWNQTK